MKINRAIKLEIEWRTISVALSILTTYLLTNDFKQSLNIVSWLTVLGVFAHLLWLKIRI